MSSTSIRSGRSAASSSTKLDGGFVQLLTGLERMQLAGDVETERQAQDLPPPESLAATSPAGRPPGCRVLPHDLAQRPVRDAVAVGETATRRA